MRYLLLLLLAGCTSLPPTPAPPAEHVVTGIGFLMCEEVVAIELVTSNGKVLYMEKRMVGPGTWSDLLNDMDALGDNAVAIEMLPGCTKT